MPSQEFIIADGSIAYNTPVNHVSRLVYTGTDWSRLFGSAKKYTTVEAAISAAKELNNELPVKVFVLQTDERGLGIGEVKF